MEYVCRRKITSVLTGLVRLGEKAATKPAAPGFDGDQIGHGQDGTNHER